MKLLAPSILSADFSNLSQQIRYAEMGGADWIHCDVMDGTFVPNITFGSLVVDAVRKNTKLPIDVHLMVEHPETIIPSFAKAGADMITVHQEACVHLNRVINQIKELDVKAGVVLNPATPVSFLENILEFVDLVLVMSVNPGFGGQSFIPNSLEKISQLKDIRDKKGYNFLIEIDGGVNTETIKSIAEAGCDVFVAGSTIFHADNITAATVELKNILTEY